MIAIDTAIYIHGKLIDNMGGGRGIRDRGSLEAALNRPFATFDGIDLYSTTIDKAAALFESVIINHPFIDGNKRTAYVLMKFILYMDGISIVATKEEKYQMVIVASEGKMRFEEIKLWLHSNTESL